MRLVVLVVTALVLAGPAALAQTTTSASGKATGTRTATQHGKIDINSATDKELERLPGIDAAAAQKIIEGRPYASVSDLSHAGFTPAQIRKLAPRVLVGSPARPPVKR